MTSIRPLPNASAALPVRVAAGSRARPGIDGGFETALSNEAAAPRKAEITAPPHGDSVVELSSAEDDGDVRKAFQSFVGQTFFGLMLKELRKSVHKTPYLHGGMAEEVFQQQLDSVLSEKLADTAGEKLANPMYELFQLRTHGR